MVYRIQWNSQNLIELRVIPVVFPIALLVIYITIEMEGASNFEKILVTLGYLLFCLASAYFVGKFRTPTSIECAEDTIVLRGWRAPLEISISDIVTIRSAPYVESGNLNISWKHQNGYRDVSMPIVYAVHDLLDNLKGKNSRIQIKGDAIAA